jgi:hypothetical protein
MKICELNSEGVVINIIEADSIEWCTQTFPDQSFVDSQDIGEIGCTWTGTEFDCSAIQPEEEAVPENPTPASEGE